MWNPIRTESLTCQPSWAARAESSAAKWWRRLEMKHMVYMKQQEWGIYWRRKHLAQLQYRQYNKTTQWTMSNGKEWLAECWLRVVGCPKGGSRGRGDILG